MTLEEMEEDSEEYDNLDEDYSEDDEEDEEEVTPVSNQEKQNNGSVNFEYKLYELFNCIKHLDRITINATPEGLELWGFNESNSMMTSAKIGKEHLRNYNLNSEVEVATDKDYLRIVKRLYMVKAYIDEQKMVFEEGKTRFEIPVYSNKADVKKPNLNLKNLVSFDLSTSEIRKALNDISAIDSDIFNLEFKDNLAIFTAHGKYGNLSKKLEPSKEGITKYEKSDNSIKVGLSVDLFKNALNGMPYKARITIGDDTPVIVEGVEDKYSHLTEKVSHYIAPRCN